MIKKGGLGRGLDALFNENATDDQSTIHLRISEIEPNRLQPRKDFDDEALNELRESIALHGVIQPLLVRPLSNGGYQIVAGERRWRASRLAGIETVPVIIKELSDAQTMELALIENLQREDLNAVEEAEGYKMLNQVYQLTQDEVSERVGKSRPAVTNALRLLNLPDDILQMVRDSRISAGHGKALLAFKDTEAQQKAAEIAAAGASVREIERMVKAEETKPKKAIVKKSNSYYSEVEYALTEELGRKVLIKSGKSKGTIEIEFYGKDDLKELANLFRKD